MVPLGAKEGSGMDRHPDMPLAGFVYGIPLAVALWGIIIALAYAVWFT